MRKIEQYTVQEGKTPLSGPELSRRFLDIDGRLHLLEELKVSWEQAVVEVQNHGLERINGVIEPVLDQANDILGQIQQELVSVQQEWAQTSQTIAQEWQDILDGWAGVQGTLDNMSADISDMQTQVDDFLAATKYVKRLVSIWFAPSPGRHPYLAENQSVQGQDVISLPADSEAWAGLRFDQAADNANQQLEFRYWMSTSDTQPINFGLAMAKGLGPLVDTPWQPNHTYTIGDKVIPTMPNGCEYQMIGGAAGIGTVDLTTGKTATASESYAGYPPENAIDDNDSISFGWATNTGTNPWWKVDLGNGGEKKVGKLRFKTRASDSWSGVKDFVLAASNDDSAYTTIFSGQHGENDLWEDFTFDCTVAYRYWRITVLNTWDAFDRYANVPELEMFELLGSNGVSAGGAEPNWQASDSWTTVDNEITWKCMRSSGGYDQVAEITGRNVTPSVYTPAELNFQLPGDGIAEGERINLLAIRKVDAPTSYWSHDVALGCSVSATYGSNPGNAVNGDDATAWLLSVAANGGAGANLTIDFGGGNKKAINRCRIFTGNLIPSSLIIYGSNDGTNWDTLWTGSSTSWDFTCNFMDNATPYRYVKVYVYVGNSSPMYVYSIELFEYLTNPGSGHQGDMHILDAYVQAQKV